MPKRELRIVLASPGDVQPERDVLPRILEELNMGVADIRNVRLELTRWETDSHPGFHPLGPQGLVDEKLKIEDCDLLIGIFWKKFGTAVADAASGTEHEIRKAYAAWQKNGTKPQMMMYFKEEPAWPSSATELEQWTKVLKFKENFPKEGLWWSYKSKEEFELLVRRHLTQFLRALPEAAIEPVAAAKPPSAPISAAAQPAPASAAAATSVSTVEQDLRRMQVNSIVLARRLGDLKDRRDRGRLDEGRYLDLAADLEREHIALLGDLRRAAGTIDQDLDAILRDAAAGQDEAALIPRLAALLKSKNFAPSLVSDLTASRGLLASSLIEAAVALNRAR